MVDLGFSSRGRTNLEDMKSNEKRPIFGFEEKMRTRRLWIVWLGVAGVLGLLIGASGTEAQLRTPSEKAPLGVAERLAAGQPQDLLVLFDDSAVESEAGALRRARGLIHDDPAILAVKAARYTVQKQDVFSSLPPGEFETLRDYSHLPMAFIRFRSSAALTRLLERMEVVAVYEERSTDRLSPKASPSSTSRLRPLPERSAPAPPWQ